MISIFQFSLPVGGYSVRVETRARILQDLETIKRSKINQVSVYASGQVS